MTAIYLELLLLRVKGFATLTIKTRASRRRCGKTGKNDGEGGKRCKGDEGDSKKDLKDEMFQKWARPFRIGR